MTPEQRDTLTHHIIDALFNDGIIINGREYFSIMNAVTNEAFGDEQDEFNYQLAKVIYRAIEQSEEIL